MELFSKKVFITSVLIFINAAVFAGPNPPPPGVPPPGNPIDENIYILLVIAIVFGIYKLRKLNKKTPI